MKACLEKSLQIEIYKMLYLSILVFSKNKKVCKFWFDLKNQV